MNPLRSLSFVAAFSIACALNVFASEELTIQHPNIAKVSIFAENPDIVTPTGIAVSPDGRVFVLENHTHQRPPKYVGPAKDRLLVFEDTDGDGAMDKRSIYHEGFEFTTDLLFAENGDLYATTRADVFRFPNAANLDKASSEPELIVHCETEGVYPHDGISGLAIDPGNPDWLYFGFGENLGFDYTFIGSDGVRFSGGGEGGSSYRCRLDGTGLEKLSTGHWNLFGMTFDLKGNLFATDNDPSSTPPNRLLNIIDGGDYGFEFRYGRSGRHPLTSWTGENPGTLGMVAPVGEAACGIISFGPNQALVASWGDNRVYLHTLKREGRGFTATRETFLSGSNLFRPVHFSYNQDATVLYLTDWAKSDYPVHGLGRIWRIELNTPIDLSPRPRDVPPEMTYAEAFDNLGSDDPYARTEAVRVVALNPRGDWRKIADPLARAHFAVALRRSDREYAATQIPDLLEDPDESVCFVATKWISDEKLVDYRSQMMEQLNRPNLGRKLMFAIMAAQQRLDGMRASDQPTPAQLRPILNDQAKPARLRALALSLMNEDDVAIDRLAIFTRDRSQEIRLEAVRNLASSDKAEAQAALAAVATDGNQSSQIRAEAILGLATNPIANKEILGQLSEDPNSIVATEALRALAAVGLKARELSPNPLASDTSQWATALDELPGKPDLDAGRRIFFHPKLATCATCHEMEGRGRRVGPDLTTINRQAGVDSEWLLTHILNPAETIAPQYQPWQIHLKDGSSKMGFVLRKGGIREAYLGFDGNEFAVRKPDIERTEELPITIMPPGLLAPLQPSEIRDLIAYLLQDK